MEWTKYTTKEALKDNDELMILDTDGKANKRTLMDKIWDYVVDKMTTAVIAKLETTNKTLIGAVNELNSNKLQRKIITELPIDKNTQFLFSVANDIGIIPAYSKGICISFEDGVIISISTDNFLYIGYRSNGNWIVKQIK